MTYDELQAILEEAFPPVAPEHPRSPYMSGDDYHTDKRNDERWAIDMFIDVLSAKGLLHKTKPQFGVRLGGVVSPHVSRESAEDVVKRPASVQHGAEVVTRDVSDWRQA